MNAVANMRLSHNTKGPIVRQRMEQHYQSNVIVPGEVMKVNLAPNSAAPFQSHLIAATA